VTGLTDFADPIHSAHSSHLSYVELHCISNFTFLRGASHPEELVSQALQLHYHALALTDECSLAGVVRAHVLARQHQFKLIIGSEFVLENGVRLVLLATDRLSYGRLSRLITVARRNAAKGEYRINQALFEQHCPVGCLALWLPDIAATDFAAQGLRWLQGLFPGKTWIAVELLLGGRDRQLLQQLQQLGQELHIPLCAAGDVHMHHRSRRALQNVLTAIRLGKPVSELGYELQANGERHMRSLKRIAQLYPLELIRQTGIIAQQCHFSLDELRYDYPSELVPPGYTANGWLRQLTEQGMQRRWPQGPSKKVLGLIQHELDLVQELKYEHYFLTVHDIVLFARSKNILCQGRGSAANSAICYCLGITEVDPGRMDLLFERFISRERNEPPDIDVDFEHERREEVIQYIYHKYGRERAALAATVITYQPRSAVRDVGKALGMSLDQVDRLAKSIYWWNNKEYAEEELQANGFSPQSPVIRRLIFLTREILGFPRHLSQHVGGFVISESLLSTLVPVENASMPGRTVIQWEKDDLEALGLLKVDVLALGMLSAIRKALAYISECDDRTITLADIPAEDPRVYKMIQQADTIGVFQIESRAQMSMLPRLKPRNYYDLVIQIAIIRPGPIQGNMVHPYLARRNGTEAVTYPNAEVEHVLQRTLGVPIFQEQVMRLSMVAAGFSAGEADQLRRSMAAWKRKGGLEQFEAKLLQGMQQRGYSEAFARQIFQQIKGFGEYGFPESHSASFALLAYASSWIKYHYPAAFTCALLNSQPMGFYGVSQLVNDARRHGVTVLPVDVNHSRYDCHLEKKSSGFALRLGLRMVKGLSHRAAHAVLQARSVPFNSVQELMSRAAIARKDLECLAAGGGLNALASDRHRAYWAVSDVSVVNAAATNPIGTTAALFPTGETEPEFLLPKPTEGENIIADYACLGLSLERHPLSLLRSRFEQRKVLCAAALWACANGAFVATAGLVISRQRPGSAANVMFVTLEDETGYVNVVVWPRLAERCKKAVLRSRLLWVQGVVQIEDGVLHLIARDLRDLSSWLGRLDNKSRDFH